MLSSDQRHSPWKVTHLIHVLTYDPDTEHTARRRRMTNRYGYLRKNVSLRDGRGVPASAVVEGGWGDDAYEYGLSEAVSARVEQVSQE